MKLPTTNIFHDTRRAKKSGLFPVKLEIYFNKKRRYYPYASKYDLSKADFGLVMSNEAKGKLKKIQGDLIGERSRAEKVIDDLGTKFSFPLFEKRFIDLSGNEKNIFSLLEALAKKLRSNDQISTAVLTECTLNSLKAYHPKKELNLDEIDTEFLENYEKWMLSKENSPSTIGMYLRRVRFVFNSEIEDETISKESYPFSTRHNRSRYQIPGGRNIKKAIRHSDIGRIFDYIPQSEGEAKAKDFWIFTYLGNGINMKDIALLKFKNWDKDKNEIIFERAKTKRTSKAEPKKSAFKVTPRLKEIIKKWGNKSIYDGNYIFPILHPNATAEEQYTLVYNAVKSTNKYMKLIAEKLNISSKATTYVARHSFATVLRNSGKSAEFIGKLLTHSNVKTTENYLGDLEESAKSEVSDLLTDFPQTGTY